MNTNITIKNKNQIAYTTKPTNNAIKFTINNFDVESEYYDKLIQYYFTKKIIDLDILPIQFNQAQMPLTNISKKSKVRSVDVRIEEELFVILQSNKILYCNTKGHIVLQKIDDFSVDVRKNTDVKVIGSSSAQNQVTYKVNNNIVCSYTRKNVLPLKVNISGNKVIIDNNEPNVVNFRLELPVKNNVYNVDFKKTIGETKFDIKEEKIIWTIKNLNEKRVELNYYVSSTNSILYDDKKRIANVFFDINPLTNSGLDIIKVYNNENVYNGYVKKVMNVKKYEIRL